MLKKLQLFFFLFVFCGCVGAKQYVPMPDLSAPIANADHGRIVLLRPTHFGTAVSIKVHEGIRIIGVTGPNSFLAWERQAGRTSIVSEAENDDVLDLELEKGQTYYIQQHIQLGLVTARSELELLPEEKGLEMLGKCKAPKIDLREINSHENSVSSVRV